MIHKRSMALERSVKKLLESLKMLTGTNLTLSSDVYQDIFGKVTKQKKTQHTRELASHNL